MLPREVFLSQEWCGHSSRLSVTLHANLTRKREHAKETSCLTINRDPQTMELQLSGIRFVHDRVERTSL
ncbi:hypothetical protein Mp_1g17890 [Marchantia polymorpha subsp. ruderalis]|uniref:Uncharacterized protein n=2 Tax=Marchantia polymorpha TaxID=3197 RepID=A0AAF6ARC9_MARPO|nr:hypothetical protein MARPO_0001s0128 [Marchantia polymorpha]BBM98999.1 hypothetical protein Mp_1g17890 [Marchantia polymorpha subsp. ruderalis]|eukprot:PTQ50075.1 hypothetical protein MARPO_0001s0128 [Marchantia polymorpha]